MFATKFADRKKCIAAIAAVNGTKYGVTHYAAGHIDLKTRDTYWMVKTLSAPLVEEGAAARSERHVYTPSGKKRTNKEVCLSIFRKIQTKAEFIAAAAEKGVKPITAITYFDDIRAGRIAA